MKLTIAISLIAVGALSACASGQFDAENPDCPDVTQLHAAHLYGSWNVELAQAGQRGTLTLRQHPEFAASLRGEFRYGGQSSIASGDVEGGEFNLDESADGQRMDAVWEGNVTPSGCGQELRGIRRPAQGTQTREPVMNFVLKKVPGWR